MAHNDWEVIIKNTDMNDPDELRDVLTLLAQQVDSDQKKIKQLEARLNRVNRVMPSTAILRGVHIPLKSEE